MSGWLKQHPFAVEAFFEQTVVLTYAFPKAALADRVPECLELDTFEDRVAFVAVAMVQTTGLRPKGFPKWLGRDFLLTGYRIFVRYRSAAGKRMRGLYILRSETDRRSMEWLGNVFTHYRYAHIDVAMRDEGPLTTVACEANGLTITVDRTERESVPLPADSPFDDWKDARRFAGPMRFTFSVVPDGSRVVIIEGARRNWTPQPVEVIEHAVPFVAELADVAPALASAFVTQKVPYSWKKGRVEPWPR